MTPLKSLTLGLLLISLIVGGANGIDTTFTYQGRLSDNGSPAVGAYDFTFILFDDPAAGSQVGPDIIREQVVVNNGTFSVALNFGDAFDGADRYLQIAVRPGALADPNLYTNLTPRQKITAIPYALHAKSIDHFTFDAHNNVLIGPNAGPNITAGANNTFIGYSAGANNTTGPENVFVGYQAGFSNQEGGHNISIGHMAGYFNTAWNNTFIGWQAGFNTTTGSDNIFLGAEAGFSNQTGSRNIFLGFQAGRNETGSDKLYIANGPDDAHVLIYGDFAQKNVGIGTTSPARTLHVNDVLRLEPRDSAPADPSEGDIYMDSTTHKLMVFDGTNWQACWLSPTRKLPLIIENIE